MLLIVYKFISLPDVSSGFLRIPPDICKAYYYLYAIIYHHRYEQTVIHINTYSVLPVITGSTWQSSYLTVNNKRLLSRFAELAI